MKMRLREREWGKEEEEGWEGDRGMEVWREGRGRMGGHRGGRVGGGME